MSACVLLPPAPPPPLLLLLLCRDNGSIIGEIRLYIGLHTYNNNNRNNSERVLDTIRYCAQVPSRNCSVLTHSLGANVISHSSNKGAITSKIQHAIKHTIKYKTSPARLAQLAAVISVLF